MDQLRLGIIGIGNMGYHHAKRVYAGEIDRLQLTAVCDIASKRLEKANEELHGVATFTCAEALISSGLVDAVLIATPHYSHPEIAIQAFAKGLHVLTEKPAGVTASAVMKMNHAAIKAGTVFGIMWNQRTNPLYLKAKEIIDSGRLGSLKRLVWIITNWYRTQSYYDSANWRATWAGEGGGVLLNQCPHQLDLWQWICGMPTKIDAKLHYGRWHDIEVEDDVTAYAEYANGATGVFITTTGDAPGTNRFEITLDGAKIICENNTIRLYELEVPISEHLKTATAGFVKPNVTEIVVETDGENPQHMGVLNAFAGAILHGTPLVAQGEEGINGLTISNAIHLSSWLGKPIELPFDEELYYSELTKRIQTSRQKENVASLVQDTTGSY